MEHLYVCVGNCLVTIIIIVKHRRQSLCHCVKYYLYITECFPLHPRIYPCCVQYITCINMYWVNYWTLHALTDIVYAAEFSEQWHYYMSMESGEVFVKLDVIIGDVFTNTRNILRGVVVKQAWSLRLHCQRFWNRTIAGKSISVGSKAFPGEVHLKGGYCDGV